jgi:2-polyprenyl-6-methoxyphenol hydroxylase-like FAD-dependent oxidoreductase
VTLQVLQQAARPSAASAQKPSSAETIVVLGGGFAGLGIALALRDSDHQVVIIERDEAAPELEPEQAFDGWKRPGVFQFRHPHVFLGRLHRMLRERYPDLLEELLRAGFWTIPVSAYGTFRDAYTFAEGDDDLTQLCGRRATFEYVLQRYVRALPNVRMIHGAHVEGIALAAEGRARRMAAIEIKRAGQRESITGDVFVDCLGRRSPVFGWLREQGCSAKEQSQQAQTMSFSRHYRLRDGARPQLEQQSGDLDFLRFAIVYGENGHFAVGFSIAESDDELMQRVRRAEGFDQVCHAIPQVKDWISQADPITPVMGVGDIRNRWIHWADGHRPFVLGLLHAGDSARETNPFYGRGCSAAFVDAHLVAEALLASRDPRQRARIFAASVRRELRPYYELSVATDRMFRARSLAARGLPVSVLERVSAQAYLSLAVPAAFEDQQVARTLLGVQHMRKPLNVLAGCKLMGRLLFLAARRMLRLSKPVPWSLPPPRSHILAPPRE